MEGPYHLTYEQKKDFSAPEISELTNIFKSKDGDNSGKIDKSELKKVLVDLGHREITDDDITTMISNVDLNDDNEVSFPEFITMMSKFKAETGEEAIHKTTTTKSGKEVIEKTSGSYKHTYSVEEKE
mgnify:FL=1